MELPLEFDDRSRSEWLEQLVGVAGAESVGAAMDLAFEAVRRLLGFERAALLRFDGEAVEVVAGTLDVAAGSLGDGRQLIEALGVRSVLRLPDPSVGPASLETLGIVVGAAVPIHVDGTVWGTFWVGHGSAHADELTPLALSMLESLGSTLGMVIGREVNRQRLEESNRRLEGYAHAAAHDLRSPLRRIRSFSQILRTRLESEELDREQLSDFADRISNGAERLDALLGSMLEHASIDTLAAELYEYTDLHALAVKICDGVTELSHGSKPTFVVEQLPEVRLPADAAERVLTRLIESALTYSPPDRVAAIDITSRPFDGGVRVHVGDRGVGIAVDQIVRSFDQALNQTADLSAIELLLKSAGATVWLESGGGTGAMFVIEFPTSNVRPALVGSAARAKATANREAGANR